MTSAEGLQIAGEKALRSQSNNDVNQCSKKLFRFDDTIPYQ